MRVEARYAAGDGLLLGSGRRWLLMAPPDDDEVVDRLWRILEDAADRVQDVSAAVLQVAAEAFGGDVPALALADLTPGSMSEVTRGDARIITDGTVRLLVLGQGEVRPRRAFLGGVVGARAVALDLSAEAEPPAASAPPGPALIDGIPPEILQARGPEGPPLPRPRPAPADSIARDLALLQEIAALEPAPDSVPRPLPGDLGSSAPRDTSEPDPRLMFRPLDPPTPEIRPSAGDAEDPGAPTGPRGPVGPDAAGGPDEDPTSHRPDPLRAAAPEETVLAVWCPQGHLTRPDQPLCRVCRAQVAPQHPQRVVRPTLGGLRLPTGEVIPLDRGVVLGRRPQPLGEQGQWPYLVTLGPEFTYVSRLHLQLTLSGWDLVARDLGSRGGTSMRPPGGAAERLDPQQPRIVVPGSTLDLAETYAIRYEVGPAPERGGPQ